MLAVFLFIIALLSSFFHVIYRKVQGAKAITEVFVSQILLFNMGIMGLFAAYAHVFMGPQTAKLIGWAEGSPFQFEVGMANLAFGVLGVLCYWIRGKFWDAAIMGWSILLLGCFVGHMMDFVKHHNTAPFNFGVYVWFNDLFLPLLVLGLLVGLRRKTDYKSKR